MVDMARMADVAQRLLRDNGRLVTFIKLDRTPADAAKPWNGPSDPRATPADTADMWAAPLHPESLVNLGFTGRNQDLVKEAEMLFIVGPGSTSTKDISGWDEVLDEGVRYGVILTEKLRPATVNVLFFVWAKR